MHEKGFAQQNVFSIKILLIVAVTLASTACGKVANIPNFTNTKGGNPTAAAQQKAFTWSGPVIVDADPSSLNSWAVNDDQSTDCTNRFTRGCMQASPLLYSDSRWFLGFSQNYLSVLTNIFSAFVNMSSLTTGTFGALGNGLGIVDSGNGIIPAAADWSARYQTFAKFSNGNVISVFQVQPTGTTVRTTYANIYNASTHRWGSAVQLGTTGAATDSAIDFSTKLVSLCRPSVATAGDGSAMVSWCEETAVGSGISVVKYARYASGAWITTLGSPSSLPYVTTSLVTPGFQGYSFDMSQFNDTIGGGPVLTPITSPAADDTYILDFQAGGSVGLNVAPSEESVLETYSVAVSGPAGAHQFSIVKDINGVVQGCETIQNLANSLANEPLYNIGTGSYITKTLSQVGVSVMTQPMCSATVTTNCCRQDTVSTWILSVVFNRGLNNIYFDPSGTANILTKILYVRADLLAGGPPTASLPFTETLSSRTTSEVSLAGDGAGNYAVVRTMPSNFFPASGIKPLAGAGAVGTGRRLVGHQFSRASGGSWVTIPKNPNVASSSPGYEAVPATSFISRQPACYTGSGGAPITGEDYVACSVRNPKILMSSAGHGLVLFHQDQALASISQDAGSATVDLHQYLPTRLYFATYGVASGFSSTASVLDADTTCSASSVNNDTPVCETASYEANATYTYRCQNIGEPTASAAIPSTRPLTLVTAINHDVPKIAAAMNPSGKAIVAYHKNVSTGTFGSPSCGSVGTFIVPYDPVSGFGNTVQIDGQSTYDTMHSAVAISDLGKMAVVWEQLQSDNTNVVIYLSTNLNGTWSTPLAVNGTLTTPNDSMMPSVSINDTGDVVVSFTYGAAGLARHQYVNHYYYH